MELDLGNLLSTSLLEYCGCDTEEDERTTDSFLMTALDSYERAPAQPIQQLHPQSTLTSPTPNSTFRPFAAPVSNEDIVKARVESVPKKLVKTPSTVSTCGKNGATTAYSTQLAAQGVWPKIIPVAMEMPIFYVCHEIFGPPKCMDPPVQIFQNIWTLSEIFGPRV